MLYRVISYKLINSSQNNMEIVSNENVSVIESTMKQAIKIKKLINLPTHLLVKPADAVKICKNLNLECKKLYGKNKNF